MSLSARRYEVNKLELMLSIATFATAVGALFAGIFGMNLRNRFEMSVARARRRARALRQTPPPEARSTVPGVRGTVPGSARHYASFLGALGYRTAGGTAAGSGAVGCGFQGCGCLSFRVENCRGGPGARFAPSGRIRNVAGCRGALLAGPRGWVLAHRRVLEPGLEPRTRLLSADRGRDWLAQPQGAFYSTSLGIILGVGFLWFAIFKYTRRKRIL